ncbi:MAG: hypothetical protein BWZ03_00233 [bacterium ADurb.BinA186]|jgi:hypothetical protein|nr:MAG: hypothetical protein BWZ03_00233 [bacterium ADurb.BinA186]
MRIKNTSKAIDRIEPQGAVGSISSKTRSQPPDNFVTEKKNIFSSHDLNPLGASTLNLSLDAPDALNPWWSNDLNNSLKTFIYKPINNQKIFLDSLNLIDILRAVSRDKNHLMETLI